MKIGPLNISWGSPSATAIRKAAPMVIPSADSAQRSLAELSRADQATLADWITSDAHTNEKLKSHLPRIIRMVRSLAETNKYFRRFLSEWVTNVIGHEGMTFQSQVSFSNGNPDKNKQLILETEFMRWKESQCWASGACYTEGAQLAERTVARDGMVFIRILRGYQNDWRYALQLLPMDYLDLDLNAEFRGATIKLGVEVDAYGKPIAYYFRSKHGADDLLTIRGRKVVRIAANDMLCRFYRESPEQLVGLPMGVAAIIALRHIDEYEISEVVAARISSMATLALEREFAEAYEGEDPNDLLSNLELSQGGTINTPPGVKANLLNPTHPNGNYPEFRKSMLKGVSAGVNLPYPRIAADASESKYSSMREERQAVTEVYRCAQSTVVKQQEQPIFEAWLEMALMSGQLPFAASQYSQLVPARWQPRGWDWVDPQKEIDAVEKEMALRLTSRKRELAKRGIDMDELDREIEADTVPLPVIKERPGKPTLVTDEDDDLDEDEDEDEDAA